MFLVLKKKVLIGITCALLFVAVIVTLLLSVPSSTTPNLAPTIVIDAGHGGRDGGASGKTTGIIESELNLDYALMLKRVCEDFGFNVVLTRTSAEGLYDLTAANKKRSDMEKRKAIIDKADPDLVISVHMNSFPLSSSSGAQVFYAKGNTDGQNLADLVSSSIKNNFPNARGKATIGDYFILNCTEKPAVLVEFGFLSNPQEEKLLQEENYKKDMCMAVLSGITQYLR